MHRLQYFLIGLNFTLSTGRAEIFPPPPPPPVVPTPPPVYVPVPLKFADMSGLPKNLSETGLFADIVAKTIATEVHSYSPQYPLWSDGAKKERWIYLPPGTVINTKDMDRWIFPVGTKFWKEFSFEGKRVETRFFVKVSEGDDLMDWRFSTYQWNEEETEAFRVGATGTETSASLPGSSKTHTLPSLLECASCHRKGGDPILGFDVLQLSSDRDPGAPHAEPLKTGQLLLKSLNAQKKLSHPPKHDVRIPTNDPKTRAALGYLHGNCGHCHNPEGFAAPSLFFNRFEYSNRSAKETAAFETGVNKPTVFLHVPGNLPLHSSFRIKKGSASQSAVVALMQNREGMPIPQMPPIGTQIIDEEAIRLIKSWIRGLR